MKSNSLAWRGALLVAIPFTLQVILVVVLACFLLQAQNELLKQSKSQIFVSKCYKLESKIIECFCDFRMTTDSHGMINQGTSRKEFDDIKKMLAEIVDSKKSDPSRKVLIDNLLEVFENVKAFFSWFLDAQSQGEAHWKVVNAAFPLRLIKTGESFLNAFSALTLSEENNLSPAKTNAQLLVIKQMPFYATCIVVFVAFVLGAIYILTIKRPLSHISENCKRLASRQTQLPMLKGKDELAELDRLVHALGYSVDEALAKEKAMIENARDMICSLNSQGIFLKTNSYSSELLGMSSEELVGKSLLDICGSEDTVRADEELQVSCATSAMRTFELTLKRQDGEPVDTRWSGVWSDRDGELFAVVHDITDEKNVERLKQDFVDMISHDLRSPLTSMLGSLSMIAAGAKGPLPEEADKEVKSAVRNVERLVEFINDLLDFQKLKAGRMQLEIEKCQLNEIVAEAIEMLKPSADEKGIDFVFPTAAATISGDRQKLSQVAVNLISNAIKFAPENSAVRIDWKTSPDKVELLVIDSGPGVPEAYRESIFDAFQQVPSSQKSKEGTGLGLAICKLIVDAHGGEIGVAGVAADDIERQPNNSVATTGSIFWIRLRVS